MRFFMFLFVVFMFGILNVVVQYGLYAYKCHSIGMTIQTTGTVSKCVEE